MLINYLDDFMIINDNYDLSTFREVIGTSYNETLIGDWQVSDFIDGREGDDYILGFGGDDYLIGHLGHDVIGGGSGNDRIYGDIPSDLLSQGNDTLTGGEGNDIMTGGKGSDLFVFNAFDGRDRITDFEQGVDKIYLNIHNNYYYERTNSTFTTDTSYSTVFAKTSSLTFNDLNFTIRHTSDSTIIYVKSIQALSIVYDGKTFTDTDTKLTNIIELNGIINLTESDFIFA